MYKTIEFVLIHFFDLCKEPSWPFSKTVKSRSRRDMRRSHDALTENALTVDQATGETHRRHHVSKDGIYRGRQLFAKASAE